MKIILFAMALIAATFLSGCNSNTISKTWTAEQEAQWKTKCVQMLTEDGVSQSVAEDHCDCMYGKTSEKYTPEEAASLTVEQEREIWEACDYSW